MTFNATTGAVSGTPTATGTSSTFYITATDALGITAVLAIQITVASALGPTAATFTIGAPAGSVVTAITGLAAGETVLSVNDTRLAASPSSVLVGPTVSVAGNITVIVTTSAGRTLTIVVTASTTLPATYTIEAVGRLTRSGVAVAQLEPGAAISGGTNANHFSIDAAGVVTVSSAGQTAGLQSANYSLTITGSAVTTLIIPTEANVYDVSDTTTLLAAINAALAASPTTDWLCRPRAETTLAATSNSAGIAIQGKVFQGTFTDPNKSIVDETLIDRNASVVLAGGSFTVRPRTPLSAKFLGISNATLGRGLVLWGSNNFAFEDMIFENTAGADSYMRQIDGSDQNLTAVLGSNCVTIRNDSASPTWGKHVFRRCVIGAPDAAPYTRYPVGVNADQGGEIVLEDCTIKNVYVGISVQTCGYFSERRTEIKNFLIDAVDGYPNNYTSSNPAFPYSEIFFASSDWVHHSPNLGSEFAGAHCDGNQIGTSTDNWTWRVSMHFGIDAMDADQAFKQTQGLLLKDIPAGIFIRGRITNYIGIASTLNGAIFARMDPNDRLVLDHCTFLRSTKGPPAASNSGPIRITVEKSFGDGVNVCGPLISNCIYGAFYDTTGSGTLAFTADPVPGGLGTRTMAGGGTTVFDSNVYRSHLTQNTGAGDSYQETFAGLSSAGYITNQGVQYAVDYTSYATIRASCKALFAVNPASAAFGKGAYGMTADPQRLMFASTRTGWPQYKALPADTQLARVSKMGFMTPDYVVNNLQPAFANFEVEASGVVSPEVDMGNPLTINRVALQIDNTFYPVTFGGSQSASIPDGGTLIADPIVVPGGIPARTKCFWITGDSVLTGQSQPGGFDKQPNNGELVSRAATLTSGWFDGSVAIPSGLNLTGPTQTGRIYGPSTVLGTGWDGRPSVMIVGDSMASPANDFGNFCPPSGVQGWLARGLDDATGLRLPHFNAAIGGTRPSGMSSRAAGKYQRRAQFIDALRAVNAAKGKVGTDGKGLPPFTAILSEHINNDASGGGTAATLQGIMDTYWAFLKSEYPDTRIIQTAPVCATWCSDNNNADPSQWTTLAGQAPRTIDTTPGTGARWIVGDAYLNNKPAVLDAVIDQSSLLMDVPTRKWLPRPYTGAVAADYAGGLTISLTTAPLVGEAIVVGAGTANAAKPAFVTAVSGSGPYTVTLFTSLVRVGTSSTVATQVTGEVVKAAGNGGDGVHASPLVHIELAAAVVSAKQAGKFGSFTLGSSAAVSAPTNTAAPAISGTATVGSLQTASTGTWTNTPTSYAYQWKRNGTAISGATASTYTTVTADGGTTLTVTVTATNAGGSASATSSGAAIAAPGGGTPWILTSGTWNDAGVWSDTAVWKDS